MFRHAQEVNFLDFLVSTSTLSLDKCPKIRNLAAWIEKEVEVKSLEIPLRSKLRASHPAIPKKAVCCTRSGESPTKLPRKLTILNLLSKISQVKKVSVTITLSEAAMSTSAVIMVKTTGLTTNFSEAFKGLQSQ